MQKFYEELNNSSAKPNSRLNWLESVRNATNQQLSVLNESALAWVSWEAE